MKARSAPPEQDGDYAHCEERLRAEDRTVWLADLFAPETKRPRLHALDAFALDLAGIRGKVREPLAGELRMQWWTDAIEGEARGDVRGHPVAAAVIDTVRRAHLSRAALTGLIDAKRDDLYDEPIGNMGEYRTRADRTEGALIGLKAQILLERRDEAVEGAARHAGRAIAIAKTFRALTQGATPMHMTIPLDLLRQEGIGAAEVLVRRTSPAIMAALGRLRREAQDEIAALRGLRSRLDPEAAAAFLGASLVEPMLRRVESPRYDPFTTPIELPQWRRQWIFWRAAGRCGVF